MNAALLVAAAVVFGCSAFWTLLFFCVNRALAQRPDKGPLLRAAP